MRDVLDIAPVVEQHLPFLRRYARALTGAQTAGDEIALETLETVLKDRSKFDAEVAPKTALFKIFHGIWMNSTVIAADAVGVDDTVQLRARERLAKLTEGAREVVLLKMLEGFPVPEIAEILDTDQDTASNLLETGLDEMRSDIKSNVMIIEDEPIIAMDIEAIVTGMGHAVVGIARTETEATDMSKTTEFDIVLADIQLADGSSGIDAVKTILGQKSDVPVIFITAFPDRLLTGARPEPTFLITKPFDEEQVRSSVSQALFFSSAEVIEPLSRG